MSAIFRWMLLNPLAVGKYLTAFVAIAAKLWLQITGNSDVIERWSPTAETLIDTVVSGIVTYGVVTGAIHTMRGPSLPPIEQAAVTAAAIIGPPVAVAVEKVKDAADVLSASKAIKPDTTFYKSNP